MSIEDILPPRREAPVCDFCAKPNPRWSYDPRRADGAVCAESVQVPGERPLLYFPNQSPWAACTRCAAIIDRGDVDVLARVCVDGFYRRMVHFVPTEEKLREAVEDYRKKFVELLPTLGPVRRASAAERASKPGYEVGTPQMQHPQEN